MSKPERDTPEGLRALLVRDHQELERLFGALLDALQADARDDARRLWSTFDDGLCRHMALEEARVLPLLRAHDAHEVDALLDEHTAIRTMLAELGVGIELHELRVQTVSDFIEQLRRHALREEALAYRWAQQNLPLARQDQVRAALNTARTLRQAAMELRRKAKGHVVPTS